jgi:hypothetical protein
MPEYTFVCDDCGCKFAEILSFAQYDQKKYSCCSCDGNNLSRSYEDDCMNIGGMVRKSDSELKTLGHIADRNRDRMSEDHKEHLKYKYTEYKKHKPEEVLPQGMSWTEKPEKVQWTKKN